MKFLPPAYTNTPGVSPALLRWTGDKDFESIRDVTQYASWLDEFDPDNWLCDPGEVELIWRIVRAGIFARLDALPPGTDPEPYADGRVINVTAYGVIRGGILYRTTNYLQSSDYLNGQFDVITFTSPGAIGIGFDILGFWKWKGTKSIDHLNPSIIPVPGEWILEMATLRINGIKTDFVPFDSCGQIDYRADSADMGSVGQQPTDSGTSLLQIARWSGDVNAPDVPRNAGGVVTYGATGLHTPWGYDPEVEPCVDVRRRWDHPGTYGHGHSYAGTGTLGGNRTAEDIGNANLDKIHSIILCTGRFGMRGSPDPLKSGDGTIVPNNQIVPFEYVPSGYTPAKALGRLREWLDTGERTLFLSPYWFGNDDVTVRPQTPGVACGVGIPNPDDTVIDSFGVFAYLQSESVPKTFVAQGISAIISGATQEFDDWNELLINGKYGGTVNQSLVDHTNRVLNGLGLSITVGSDHGYGSGGNSTWNTNIHLGVDEIELKPEWPTDLPVRDIDAAGNGYLMPVTGGTTIATGKLIKPGNDFFSTQMVGNPRRLGALPEPAATRTISGAHPLVVMETVGASRVFFCSVHTVSLT